MRKSNSLTIYTAALIFMLAVAIKKIIDIIRYVKIKKSGVSAEGVIVEFDEFFRYGGSLIRYPIVEFTDENGETRKAVYKSRVKGGRDGYEVGCRVAVKYDSFNPEKIIFDGDTRFINFAVAEVIFSLAWAVIMFLLIMITI